MNAEDAYSIKIASQLSIKNEKVFFTMTWIENNSYKNSIFRLYNGEIERVTNGGFERSVYATENGIYFIQRKENKDYLMFLNDSGKCKIIGGLYKIYKFKPTSEGFIILGEEDADKDQPYIAKKLRYRDGWGRGFLWTRPSLYKLNEDGEVKPFVKGEFDIIDFDIKNNKIIFASTEEHDDLGLADVYEMSLISQTKEKITSGSGEVKAVAFGPDGDIVYAGHRNGRNAWAVDKIVFPKLNKEVVCGFNSSNSISTDLFTTSQSNLIWDQKSKELIYIGTKLSYCSLYRMQEIGGFKPELVSKEHISVKSFDRKDGHLAYSYTDAQHPSVINFDGFEYDLNPGVLGVKPIEIHYQDADGWLMLNNKQYPTILSIHGGRPYYAYGDAYSIEFQFLYSNGFNVMYCNPKVTSNYGEEFAKASMGDGGDREMKILLNFFRKTVENYDLKGKFGVTGGSYGGYLTNRIIGISNEFSAAISERSISNQLSMVGTSDDGFWFTLDDLSISGYPYTHDNIINLLRKSPIWNARDINTPVLFIHGEDDFRAPIEQSEQLYVALKLNRVETELIRYQNETHEHARAGHPMNMRHRLNSKLEWFSRFLNV